MLIVGLRLLLDGPYVSMVSIWCFVTNVLTNKTLEYSSSYIDVFIVTPQVIFMLF